MDYYDSVQFLKKQWKKNKNKKTQTHTSALIFEYTLVVFAQQPTEWRNILEKQIKSREWQFQQSLHEPTPTTL